MRVLTENWFSVFFKLCSSVLSLRIFETRMSLYQFQANILKSTEGEKWPRPAGCSWVTDSWERNQEWGKRKLGNPGSACVSTSYVLCQISSLSRTPSYVQFAGENGTDSSESYYTMEQNQQEANQSMLPKESWTFPKCATETAFSILENYDHRSSRRGNIEQ